MYYLNTMVKCFIRILEYLNSNKAYLPRYLTSLNNVSMELIGIYGAPK